MKFIDLAQNSPEWLEFRHNKIGASDAPIILGVSPFKTPYQLYLDKVERTEQAQSRAMKRGHDMEEEARQAFETMYETIYMDKVTVVPYVVQSDIYEWMIASLDGLDIEKGVMVEIKCPGQKDHDIAVSGKIPEHYIPQLQHQLFVTGLQKMFYFSYRTGNSQPVLLEYIRDPLGTGTLVHKEIMFQDCVLTKTPPELKETDYEELVDLDTLELAMQYSRVKDELEVISSKELSLKMKLIELSNGRNCRVGRVKISQCSRKGTVDYSKIEQLSGVDLDRYRKPGTTYTQVSIS